jgi:tripartite-type tricarboxylate transporter receptor subunit TctC
MLSLMRIVGVCAAIVLGTCPFAARIASAQDFTNKTIEIVVPYDTGGVTDLEARAFSRVLPDKLPGKPAVIVRNMPGGGGLIGVNWLGEIAQPDGTAVLIWTWSPMLHLMKDPGLRVQLSDYVPVGGLYFGDVAFMRTDVKPEYKEPADFLKVKELWFGGLGVANNKDIMGRLQLDILGAKYGYISSYRGSQDLVLAVQRNELQFTTVSSNSWKGQVGPNLVGRGVVRPLWQSGRMAGDITTREPELSDLPTFEEFYKAIHGKEPSGTKWEMYKFLRGFRGSMSDAVLLPPKTPPAIAKTIQAGFDKAARDPTFVADHQKLANTPPQWIDGAGAEKVFLALRTADPAVGQFLTSYVAEVTKDKK